MCLISVLEVQEIADKLTEKEKNMKIFRDKNSEDFDNITPDVIWYGNKGRVSGYKEESLPLLGEVFVVHTTKVNGESYAMLVKAININNRNVDYEILDFKAVKKWMEYLGKKLQTGYTNGEY